MWLTGGVSPRAYQVEQRYGVAQRVPNPTKYSNFVSPVLHSIQATISSWRGCLGHEGLQTPISGFSSKFLIVPEVATFSRVSYGAIDQ